MEEEFERIDEENSWTLLYQYIRSKAKEHGLPHREARKACNVHLNRYKDVYPYDHSRICLQRADTNYINASLVPVTEAKRSYILAQGPLPTTTSHFWAMVWEQKSKAIVMLNRIVEKNIIKCHKYWPSYSEDEFIFEDVSLKVSNQKEEVLTDYIIRHLMLADLKTNESRLIYHFHYVTWPDFGVPETPEQFLHFLKIVREKGVLDDVTTPPVVHCSAGIGRSGTFCLVDSSLVMIKKGKNLDISSIKDLLLEMRRYRMGLIQTADQLRFSYLAIIEGAKNIMRENRQPSLDKKPKMTEVMQDNTESSPEDSELKLSETPEESLSSSEEGAIFEDENDLVVVAEQNQNYSETLENNDTVETESSDESEDTLNDSSDETETEIDLINNKSADSADVKTEPTLSDIASDESLCETTCKDINNLGNEIQNNVLSSIDKNPNNSELSVVSQQSCSLNNATGENTETVRSVETSNEISNRNQETLPSSMQSQSEILSVSISVSNGIQPLAENPENSENCQVLGRSQGSNNIHPCEDRKHCSSDSTPCFHPSSNEEYNEADIAGIMSRHLEFYQNGDISSTKKYKCNINNKNSQPSKEKNKSCNSVKKNKKHSSKCNHRSSSCPRQLPSVSSESSQSKIDGGVRKRRNSTESAHLPNEDGTVPLKFQKMYKNHRDPESQIVEELVVVEDAYNDTSCEDRPKESILRCTIQCGCSGWTLCQRTGNAHLNDIDLDCMKMLYEKFRAKK